MQTKILSIVRTSESTWHYKPEERLEERKIMIRARLEDAPEIASKYGTQFVPDFLSVTEELIEGGNTPDPYHYREVFTSGGVVRKNGTVGKTRCEESWRTYSSPQPNGSLEHLPESLKASVQELLPQRFTFGKMANR